MVIAIRSRIACKKGLVLYKKGLWICKSRSSLKGFHVIFITMYYRLFASGRSLKKRISVSRRFLGKGANLKGL
jgi:capsule polysaccharide export protein KpsE/RkpR